MQIRKDGPLSFIDAAHIHILFRPPLVHPLIPPHKISLPLLSNVRDWPLHVVEEEIVTDVHKFWKTNHLNHVQLYTESSRLLFNFA